MASVYFYPKLFSNDQLSLFATGKFQLVDMVSIHFYDAVTKQNTDVVNIWSASHDEDIDLSATETATFYGGGILASIGSAQYEAEMNRKTTNISVSSLNMSFVAAVQQEAYQKAPVIIRRGIFDADGEMVGYPVVVFTGVIETAKLTTGTNDSMITFGASHELYNYSRKKKVQSNRTSYENWITAQGWPASTETFNEFFDADKMEDDIKWGRS